MKDELENEIRKQVQYKFSCSEITRSNLLLPLLKEKFVLGLGQPFLVQLLTRQEFLDYEHLFHYFVYLCPLVLCFGHIDPDLESLLLADENAITHHRFQK